MARLLRMPELAEDPTEGILAEWLVEESAAFVGAQSLATVETEKLLVSVEVSEPGVLVKTLVAIGAQVDPGTPLAVLADPGETVEDIDALMAELGVSQQRTQPRTQPTAHATPEADPPSSSAEPAAPEPAYVPRRLASELRRAPDLDDPLVVGEPRTRSVADVLGLTVTHPAVPVQRPVAAWEPEPARERAPEPAPEAGPLATEVGNIAQVRLRETVRAEALLAVLDEINAESQRVSLTDLVVKAVAAAYDAAALGDARPIIDVAVVVPTTAGLATPLVGDVGSLTVSGIHATLAGLAARVVDDRLLDEEAQPGVITVVDLGAHGVAELSVDVTPSRRAVLAIGAVRHEPVVENAVLVPGQVLTLTLSIDQELADASLAARWVGVLVELLEHPVRFLA